MARLLVFRDDVLEREVELGAIPVRIGRGGECDLVLDDTSKGVSRNHAELRFEGGRYTLVDLESQNGIWNDGARVPRATFFRDTKVTLGPYKLMVEDGPKAGGYPGSGETMGSDATQYMPPPPGARGTGGDQAGASTGDSRVQPARSGFRAHSGKLWLGGGGLLAAAAVTLFAVTREPKADQEAIAQHLADARVLIQQQEYQRAINEHLVPALVLDPENTTAADLKAQAEAADQAPPPIAGGAGPVVDAGSRPAALGDDGPPPDIRGTRPFSRIPTPASSAAAPVSRPAPEVPRELPRVAPTQEQQAEQAARERATLETNRAAARQFLQQGTEAAARDQWDEAIADFRRAQQLDPTLNTDARIREVTDKKVAAAQTLLIEADVDYKTNRNARALERYLRVKTLLPANHEKQAYVDEKIRELRK